MFQGLKIFCAAMRFGDLRLFLSMPFASLRDIKTQTILLLITHVLLLRITYLFSGYLNAKEIRRALAGARLNKIVTFVNLALLSLILIGAHAKF